MHKTIPSLFIAIISLVYSEVFAQAGYKIHSHNDYVQNVPFWKSYSNGASSIEVDLFLKDGQLHVTHHEDEIEVDKTFESLYLMPLKTLSSTGELQTLQLLIDLKSEAYSTLNKVIEVLTDYPTLIQSDKVTFVISGNRPKPEDYDDYPEFIHFDHQDLTDLDDISLDKVSMISKSLRDYTIWNGYGRLTSSDLNKVNAAIEKAHQVGKPFRFWATPDTKTAWNAFAQLGVDYINTDKPAEARVFLDKLDQNIYTPTDAKEVYEPLYKYNPQATPENIILMIGDGNGLAQISTAMIANDGQLTITNIRDIGLVHTAAADDLVTDSAAGGTAMATGIKTNNRAIGVNPSGEKQNNLVEILSKKNYRTGIITTDAIIGATPSSFYAHTIERDDSETIVKDLLQSPLDFFIGGGRPFSTVLDHKFINSSLEDFDDLDHQTAVYLGDNKVPSMRDDRGPIIPQSTKQTLDILQNDSSSFFLMIEGAQIDNGGHSNDVHTIIEEMLDFDQTVGEALRFADTHQNTLVIITADHETGGLGISSAALNKSDIRADFLSVDHSGILVPIFAYGPQAFRFCGVMDNTDIFHKILAALK